MSTAPTASTWTPKPIRDLAPADLGGIVARKGFAFQDHFTAQFCLEMMLGGDPIEVWCETYDDIVLIRKQNGQEIVEFTQVKNEALDQLWSAAKLCQQKDGEAGTSILEKNLARDCCSEAVQFRVCTSLSTNKELEPLTLPLGHKERAPDTDAIKQVRSSLSKKIGLFTSPNGNGVDFWIANATWTAAAEEAVILRNKRLLHQLLENNEVPAYIDTVDQIYEDLVWRVKQAAEADWKLHRNSKTLERQELLQWLLAQATPLPNLKHEQRLELKLKNAGMDQVAVDMAVSLRRQYIAELRQPRYLDTKSSTFFSDQVPAVLNRLRSELDSGQRTENGVTFHQTCVQAVSDIPNKLRSHFESDPPDGFLQGCMYEVTARCRHRFVPPST
ncbi:MAG TPA: dsDNA nuclease domain-containing protein [Terriglobia bacterium]|nr:dsDNA nuclease domain-containing protein [Terriglobia bacterium]